MVNKFKDTKLLTKHYFLFVKILLFVMVTCQLEICSENINDNLKDTFFIMVSFFHVSTPLKNAFVDVPAIQ